MEEAKKKEKKKKKKKQGREKKIIVRGYRFTGVLWTLGLTITGPTRPPRSFDPRRRGARGFPPPCYARETKGFSVCVASRGDRRRADR